LLQAIAADGIIPFLRPFAVTSKNGEPRRALFLTIAIAEAGVLLANVDYIAPIITMLVLFTMFACQLTVRGIKSNNSHLAIDHFYSFTCANGITV